jgi:predicted phosphoribosyltransferase
MNQSPGNEIAIRVAVRALNATPDRLRGDVKQIDTVIQAACAAAVEMMNVTLACVSDEDVDELVEAMRDELAMLEELAA